MAQVLYGPAIHEVIARKDLAAMKQLAVEAEERLRQMGDLRAALEYLKLEITRLEHGANKKQS